MNSYKGSTVLSAMVHLSLHKLGLYYLGQGVNLNVDCRSIKQTLNYAKKIL